MSGENPFGFRVVAHPAVPKDTVIIMDDILSIQRANLGKVMMGQIDRDITDATFAACGEWEPHRKQFPRIKPTQSERIASQVRDDIYRLEIAMERQEIEGRRCPSRPAPPPFVLTRRQIQQSRRRRKYLEQRLYQVLRRAYLAEHPVCEECGAAPSEIIHHKLSRQTHLCDVTIFQACCKPCERKFHKFNPPKKTPAPPVETSKSQGWGFRIEFAEPGDPSVMPQHVLDAQRAALKK